jgi:hypothetical protein
MPDTISFLKLAEGHEVYFYQEAPEILLDDHEKLFLVCRATVPAPPLPIAPGFTPEIVLVAEMIDVPSTAAGFPNRCVKWVVTDWETRQILAGILDGQVASNQWVYMLVGFKTAEDEE